MKEEALQDINGVLGIQPHFGITDNELFEARYRLEHLNPRRTRLTQIVALNIPMRLLFFQGNRRIWNVNYLTWAHPANRHIIRSVNSRACYLYDSGSILLHDPIWCRQSMIHELLHSTSLFSKIFFTYNQNRARMRWWELQRVLREGITETLTGYILRKKYADCYEAWRTDRFEECSVSGRSRVKLWCSLCQHIRINKLAEFYLSEQNNLSDPWNQFVRSVIDMGYEEFSYPLNENIGFNDGRFRQICIDTIPGFRETYDSLNDSLDFYKIP